MITFDNKAKMIRKSRAVSFEYNENDQRILKVQHIDSGTERIYWPEHRAIWDDEMKIWIVN